MGKQSRVVVMRQRTVASPSPSVHHQHPLPPLTVAHLHNPSHAYHVDCQSQLRTGKVAIAPKLSALLLLVIFIFIWFAETSRPPRTRGSHWIGKARLAFRIFLCSLLPSFVFLNTQLAST